MQVKNKMDQMIKIISDYQPCCKQEERDREITLELIAREKEQILQRACELYHITSSGFVLNETGDKFLLVHHNIYNAWSWIGGHADGEADLISVAKREIHEESGIIHAEAVTDKIISIDILTTSSHYRKQKYVPAHLHLNISFLFVGKETDRLRIKEDENSKVAWVPLAELNQYDTGAEAGRVFQKIKKYVSTHELPNLRF